MIDINNFLNNITFATFLSWLLLGLIVGLVVHWIDPGGVRGGILGTIITGIIGAIIGGLLANLFLGIGITGVNLESVLIALGGALVLVILERILLRDQDHIKTKTTRLQ